tara:strand:+ start:196 stop:804 length:609 start_codon:yes stop_codon:yes gene_type:complete
MATKTKKTQAETAPKSETKGKETVETPTVETPKPVTREQLQSMAVSIGRKTATYAKRRVDALRDADGNLPRERVDDAQPGVIGDSVTLISPEFGRDGVELPGCTGSNPEDIGNGIANLAERFDQKIAITGRADTAEVSRGKRDHFLRRFANRLSQAGRDDYGVKLSVNYAGKVLDDYLESNPEASLEEAEAYAEDLTSELQQ